MKKVKAFILYILIIVLTISQPLQSMAVSGITLDIKGSLRENRVKRLPDTMSAIKSLIAENIAGENRAIEEIEELSVPTELICEEVTDTTITISWRASEDNESQIKYNIYDREELLAENIEGTRYTLEELLPGTRYNITIIAIDEAGNMSDPSDVLIVTTEAETTRKVSEYPEIPVNLTASRIYNSVLLEWDNLEYDEENQSLVRGYSIYRNGEEIDQVDNLYHGYKKYRYVDKSINIGEEYVYEIALLYDYGNESSGRSNPAVVETSLDSIPPTTPRNLKNKWKTNYEINISWEPAFDNDSMVAYEIFRDGESLGISYIPEYTENGHEFPMGIYEYQIRAVDFSGNTSELSDAITVELDGTKLDDHGNNTDSVTIIELDRRIKGEMEYYWDEDYFKFRTDISGMYKLEFSEFESSQIDYGINWEIYDSNHRFIDGGYYSEQNPNALRYVNLKGDTEYFFIIEMPPIPSLASEINSESFFDDDDDVIWGLYSSRIASYEFIIHSPDNPPSNLQVELTANNEVILTWEEPEGNIDISEYIIGRNGEEIGITEDNTYIDLIPYGDSSYVYQVMTLNRIGEITSVSNKVTVTIGEDNEAPSPPNYIFETMQENSTVTFIWDGAEDNIGVAGYEIYKNDEKIGETKETTFVDTGIEIEEIYFYTIKAYDEAGNISEESDYLVVEGDHGNTIDSAYSININQKYKIKINYPNDIDYLKFTVEKEDIYKIATPAIILMSLNPDYYNPTIELFNNKGELVNFIDKEAKLYRLVPNLEYYIKISKGIVGEEQEIIAVASKLASPENLRVMSKDINTITLEWNPPHNGEGISYYRIYRDDVYYTSTSQTSYTDEDLTPDTTYTYKVSSFGYNRLESDFSNSITVTTDKDNIPPTAPNNLKSELKEGGLTLQWTRSTDNWFIQGYEIYKNNELIGTAVENYYEDKNNIYNQENIYKVRAYDQAGNYSEMSNEATFYDDHGNFREWATTVELDSLIDGSIGYKNDYDYFKFTVPATGGYMIESYGNTNVYGYIYDKDGNQLAANDDGAGNRNFFIGIELQENQEYFVMVRGYSSNVTGNYQIKITEPPKAPENLEVISKTITSIEFKWDKSPENKNVTSYKIYRDNKYIGETTNTNYKDTMLYSNREYSYRVTAIYKRNNYQRETLHSVALEVTTDIDTEAPSTPTNLRITDRNSSSVKLRWNESRDNGRIERYDIYRDGELIGSSKQTSYEDKGLSLDIIYSYTVKAIDQGENSSDFSNTLRCSPERPTITRITPETNSTIGGKSQQLRIYITNISGLESSNIKAEYSKDNINWQSLNLTGPQEYNNEIFEKYYYTNWDLTKIPEGTYETYNVKITLSDPDGFNDEKTYSYMIDRKAPREPRNPNAKSTSSGIRLTWEQPADADIDSYIIYRCDTIDGIYTKIATVNGKDNLHYIDKNVIEDMTYYYKISAMDKFNQEGNPSEVVSATVERDITAPIILGIEPVNNTILGRNANITVRAEDDNMLKAIKIQYSKDSIIWTDINTSGAINRQAYTWNTTWNTEGLNGETFLRAIATDISGNESSGEPIRIYIIDNEGPGKVENLTAKATATTVILKWSYTQDEDFSHFAVEQKQSEDGEYKEIGTVKDVLGMEIKGLKTQTNYWFRVVAYDIRGNRGIPSEEVQIITIEDTISPVINSINPKPSRYSKVIPLEITATDNMLLALVTIQSSRDKNNWTQIARIEPEGNNNKVTINHILNIEGEEEGSLYIRAIAADLSENESSKDETAPFVEYIIDHTAPNKPQNIEIKSTAGDITISWTQNPEKDLGGYNIYRAQKEEGPYEKIQENHRYLSYTDKDLLSNTTYHYKISATDIAGNEGEAAGPVSSALIEDKEAPEILSIAPIEGNTLGSNPVIRVLVKDNYKLKKVWAEYKESHDEIGNWIIIEEKNTDKPNDIVSMNWNTSNIEEGSYVIRITAEDLAGNKSEEKLVSYDLNLEAPRIESFMGIPRGWSAELNWTTDNAPGIHLYRIYRSLTPQNGFKLIKEIRETEETTYTDERIAPIRYYYKLQALDKYGNSNWSEEIAVTPTSEDPYPPTAEAGDDKTATIGMEVLFDGSLSKDNDQTTYYHWDFGDGNTSNQISPMYAYDEEGTYTATLTVKDRAGNIGEDTTTVEVYPPQKVGTLNITILEENTGTPIGGASIAVEYSNGKTQKITADNKGNIEIIAPEGSCKIYAYNTGYMPMSKGSTIKVNNITKETLFLDRGNVLQGEIKVERMTLEELKEAGIDTTDPENQWVYKFDAHLKFAQVQLEPIIVTGGGGFISGWGGGGGLLLEYKGVGYKATPQVIAHQDHPEIPPTFGYLLIPVEASWLREFFSVNLMLFNAATEEFPLTEARAKLNLPEGLALAPTKETQEIEIDLGTIEGQETKEVNWIIRGDKKGEYHLEAEVNANIQPFDDPVKSIFKTKDPIKVWAEEAMVMHIVAEDWAFNNSSYTVYFGLENVANFPIYNPHITIDEGKGYTIKKVQEAESTKEELKPGQIHWLEATLIPYISLGDPEESLFKLDLSKSFTVKTGGNVTEVTTKIWEIESRHIREARENNYGQPGIYIPTGTYTHGSTDISMTAPGFILNISRTYNSRDEEEGILGKGWAFGFEGKVKSYETTFELEDGTKETFTDDTIKRVKLPDGSAIIFEKEEEGYTTKYSRAKLEETEIGYTLTTKDQYKYEFNKEGYMEYMEDRNGNRINIDTDNKGNILKAYDNLGRSFIFTYNSEDLLESIKGPKNKTITYYYEDKQLKKVQDPEGRYTYYNYDEEGKLEEVKDNEENTIEKIVYNYDAGPDKEKVNQLTDRFGNTHNYGYNNMERKVTIIDTVTERENRQRVQWYNKDFQAEKDIDEEGNITEIMYNSNGEEMKKTLQ